MDLSNGHLTAPRATAMKLPRDIIDELVHLVPDDGAAALVALHADHNLRSAITVSTLVLGDT